MGKILIVLLIGMFALPLMGFDKQPIKEFKFDKTEISGTGTKPHGVSINTLQGKLVKTTIKPRGNFLPELSSSVDEF